MAAGSDELPFGPFSPAAPKLECCLTNGATSELTEARDNFVLGKLEKRLQRADLLILDEMGYVSFDHHQSELLFRVVADRSERGSIIVTTNLPFSEWPSMFDSTPLVEAASRCGEATTFTITIEIA